MEPIHITDRKADASRYIGEAIDKLHEARGALIGIDEVEARAWLIRLDRAMASLAGVTAREGDVDGDVDRLFVLGFRAMANSAGHDHWTNGKVTITRAPDGTAACYPRNGEEGCRPLFTADTLAKLVDLLEQARAMFAPAAR